MSITRGKNGVPDEFSTATAVYERSAWDCTAVEYGEYAQISRETFDVLGDRRSNCKNCGAPYEPVKCSYCGTHH